MTQKLQSPTVQSLPVEQKQPTRQATRAEICRAVLTGRPVKERLTRPARNIDILEATK